LKRIIASVIVASSLVAAAQATQITINSMVPGRSEVVTINYKGQNSTVYAGAQSVSVNGATPIALYCVDLDHHNKFGDSYGVNITGVNVLNNSTQVSNLMTNFWSSIASSTDAAAFQLALWDSVVDGADGLATGQFEGININASISAKVAQYQAAINQSGPENLFIQVYQATNHGPANNIHQDLIGAEAVPEPTTIIALAGIATAFARRRKVA
jgi:hypothetical protein